MTNIPDDVLKAAEYVRDHDIYKPNRTGEYKQPFADPEFGKTAKLLAAYLLGPDLIQCQVKYLPGEGPTNG